MRSFYGGEGATLTDGAGNIFVWALREVVDRHGNVIRYSYAQVDDIGVDRGSEPGRNLYPKRITYTGQSNVDGHYAVTFIRDRELNESLRVDKMIDARGGFKRVIADRLRRVDVAIDNSLIRRYEFSYTTGVFRKTLLHSIAQLDGAGAVFNTHTFTYYDDVRDSEGNYQVFSPAQWTVPGDGLSKGELNLTDENAGNASALNANTSLGGGGHLYVGIGESASKSNTVGVKVGFNHTSDDGVLALIDVDGDSLPDKVFRSGGTVKYRKNLSGPHGQLRFSDQAQPLALPGLTEETSNSLTLGVEAYPGAVAVQLDYVNTFATTDRYLDDVNGDEITDLVSGSSVLFGRVGADGVPVYGVSADTPVPVTAGQVDTGGLLGNLGPDRERMIDSFPLLDTVRRWVAPDGAVRQSRNQAGNASAGSSARTIPTGLGYGSSPGHTSANTAEAGNDMPPLGVTGEAGLNSSDTQFDLLDVNGDGLPDRVYADGDVRLNLGYSFGARDTWRNPAPVNDGEGGNVGLSLGFNVDFYGFAGGASFNQGTSSTHSTLVDVTGDELLDRVFATDPITVGINTGNGFESPVEFRGGRAGINAERNATLGAGAYATFPICFVFASSSTLAQTSPPAPAGPSRRCAT
jgi:hypothetical protein